MLAGCVAVVVGEVDGSINGSRGEPVTWSPHIPSLNILTEILMIDGEVSNGVRCE